MTIQDTSASAAELAAYAAFSSAPRIASLLRRLCALNIALLAATFLPGLASLAQPADPGFIPAVAAAQPILLLARAVLIVSLSGLLATTLIVTARARTLHRETSRAIIRAAGSPQALLLCTGAAIALATLHSAFIMATPTLAASPLPTSPLTGVALLLPISLLLAAFLMLIGERAVAALNAAALPEAASLSALLRLPVLILIALALFCLLAARIPSARSLAERGTGLLIAASALEMAIRTLKVWYAPPPTMQDGRAAIGSLVTTLLDPRRLSPNALGASLTRNFGIDFARSWALRFARRALPPVLAALLCICWALTGASRVGLDQRAVYERFGAPVAVLGPGLHLLLPWPLGRARLGEYGIIHSIVLADSPDASPALPDRSGAEGIAPASANRLWDQSENDSSYLVARADDGRQSFEALSVDLRVLYRVGLSPQAARDALYRTTDPQLLIRALARRLLSRMLAAQTLSDVMVERHDQLAGSLRHDLQSQLDAARSGIEIVGLVIESLHPPAGAASAYRAVQAAQIAGGTAIAEEQGRARGTASLALRDANDTRDAAQATAAETLQTGAAEQTRMLADERAAKAGGPAFLIERRFADLRAGLAQAPLEIIDQHLPSRLLDLRAAGSRTGNSDIVPAGTSDQGTDPDQEGRQP